MARRSGLGKGLGALLEEENTESEHATVNKAFPAGINVDDDGQLWVNPALLKPNPHQPRQEFNEDALQELAESIKEHGVVQSITIEDAGDGSFYIIAGERRTRAAMLAGLEKVPVQLRHYSDVRKLEVALIENIQRADLNPIEEANAYNHLMQMGNLSQDDVAKRVGKKRSTIANSLRLLKLPEEMQGALINGKISAGHARALLSVASMTAQKGLFEKIVGNGMSVRDAEKEASLLNNSSSAGLENSETKKSDANSSITDTMNNASRDPDINAMEQKFIDVLGTKVVLKGNLERGSLQIDYFSRSDLERIYNILVGNKEN
ncbi:MAG: ParB/RepB/Spo0J family partition protein [Treponema sp.]|nr:ParB/RepB/Spo0J family partition protein [Treponema sp.]